jgi:predicted GIY-YIG superfamily endonuclease
VVYYIYILLNDSKTRTYTGVTDDVDKRPGEHNAGRIKSSNPYRPYKVRESAGGDALSALGRKLALKAIEGRSHLSRSQESGLGAGKRLDSTGKSDISLSSETECPAMVAGCVLYGKCREKGGILARCFLVDIISN